MAKPPHWQQWRDRYGPINRGTDTGSPGESAESLDRFIDRSHGPVAVAFLQYELVHYDSNGQVVVNPNFVVAQARELSNDLRDAAYPKKYLIKTYIENHIDETISERSAEGRINTEYAAHAQAVIAAGKIAQIAFTEAQNANLKTIAEGKYLDTKYGQFKSGERGTLLGPKKVKERRNPGLDATQEAAAERRRVFYSEIMRKQ